MRKLWAGAAYVAAAGVGVSVCAEAARRVAGVAAEELSAPAVRVSSTLVRAVERATIKAQEKSKRSATLTRPQVVAMRAPDLPAAVLAAALDRAESADAAEEFARPRSVKSDAASILSNETTVFPPAKTVPPAPATNRLNELAPAAAAGEAVLVPEAKQVTIEVPEASAAIPGKIKPKKKLKSVAYKLRKRTGPATLYANSTVSLEVFAAILDNQPKASRLAAAETPGALMHFRYTGRKL